MTEVEDVFVVYALQQPSHDSMPFDIGALFGGGNLGLPTHCADLCNPTVSDVRQLGRMMRDVARSQGTDLRFVKLLRRHDLMAWAERNDAKVLLPTPQHPCLTT